MAGERSYSKPSGGLAHLAVVHPELCWYAGQLKGKGTDRQWSALSGTSGPTALECMTVFSDAGWSGLACLFLGWLAVMGGTSQQATRTTPTHSTTNDIRDMRPGHSKANPGRKIAFGTA